VAHVQVENKLDVMDKKRLSQKDDLRHSSVSNDSEIRLKQPQTDLKKFDVKIVKVVSNRSSQRDSIPEAINQSNRMYQTAELKNEAAKVNKSGNLTLTVEKAHAVNRSLKAKLNSLPQSQVESHATIERSSPLLGKGGSEHQASFNILKPRMMHAADSANSGSIPHFLQITIHNTNQSINSHARDKEQERKDQAKIEQSKSRLYEKLGAQLINVGKKSLNELGCAPKSTVRTAPVQSSLRTIT